MGHGLLLHGGVDNHPLQVLGLHGLDRHRGVDRRLEQFFHSVFAQGAAKAPDLRGVARQAVFEVRAAAEELPQHVLAPARDQLFIAQVEGVFEIQQAEHQAQRQPRTTGGAGACARQHLRGAEQVVAFHHRPRALAAGELGGDCRFELRPRQPRGQHRQRIVQVDHGIDAAAEKVGRGHAQIPQKSVSPITFLRGFGGQENTKK